MKKYTGVKNLPRRLKECMLLPDSFKDTRVAINVHMDSKRKTNTGMFIVVTCAKKQAQPSLISVQGLPALIFG